MPQCFVIQPFDDNQKFDRRYAEVFKPAIERAGLTAYRVDHDPSVSIPIHSIESEIRRSDVCFADITERNPNVWFEVGFALAAQKDVVFVCEEGSYERFPFDIQHRTIIKYAAQSPSDYEKLEHKITERLRSTLANQEQRAELAISPALKPTDGLASHEIAALVNILPAELEPDHAVPAFAVVREMELTGFTRVATIIAIKNLERRGFVKAAMSSERGDEYKSYSITSEGMNWVISNSSKLELRQPLPKETDPNEIPF